jgi:two-component system OmpR family sensor kinase
MSGIDSWARRYWPELAWGVFAALNFAALVLIREWETVPFHYIWVSLTLVYGFRVWRMRATLITLFAVCLLSVATYGWVVINGPQGVDELTEIPLMAAMFLAMVWHARRRQFAIEAMERAAARERDFVRDASHKLKTPIAVARAMADLMRQSRTTEPQDMSDLVEELDRLGRIAAGMLELATAEQHDNLVRAPVDFEDIVVSAARRWSHAAEREWDVDVRADGTLMADRDRVDAALDAVVENAVAATTTSDSVVIVARAEAGDAIVEVRDSGVGIAAVDLPRIFDRFSSVPHANGNGVGSGLGLAIAKAIVEAHGGRVRVRSTPGRGTTVSLRFPGLVADPEPSSGARDARPHMTVG